MVDLTSLTKNVFHGLSMGSRIFGPRKPRRVGPNNIMNFFIAYTRPHLMWTEGLKHGLTDALSTEMPQVQVNITSFVLPIDRGKALDTLHSHPVVSGTVKEPGHTFIITPGWSETMAVNHARARGVVGLPQLFCLPSSPTELFMAAHQREDRAVIGGVHAWPTEPEKYIDLLTAVQTKKIAKVLIPINETDGTAHMIEIMRYQVAELKKEFALHGIEVATQRWSYANMERFHMLHHLKTCDAIITLHEPTADLHGKAITDLCTLVGKLHFASNLDLVYQGAAMGVGTFYSDFAKPLTALIAKYYASPSLGLEWETFCIPPQSGGRVNTITCESQGIELDRKQKTLLASASIHDLDKQVNYLGGKE